MRKQFEGHFMPNTYTFDNRTASGNRRFQRHEVDVSTGSL